MPEKMPSFLVFLGVLVFLSPEYWHSVSPRSSVLEQPLEP